MFSFIKSLINGDHCVDESVLLTNLAQGALKSHILKGFANSAVSNVIKSCAAPEVVFPVAVAALQSFFLNKSRTVAAWDEVIHDHLGRKVFSRYAHPCRLALMSLTLYTILYIMLYYTSRALPEVVIQTSSVKYFPIIFSY